ncbi:MAG: response regulator [Rickettsiaceae bacterium H1]|nr:response regulator [Rickettsiaceae bacterium H1]
MRKRYVDLVRKNKVDFAFRPHGRVTSLVFATAIYVITMIVLTQFSAVNIFYPVFTTFLYVSFFIFKIKQNSNTLNHVEFQNALFANALKKNNQFFLIISQNGAITYNDERSGIKSNNLEEFLDNISLVNEKKELIFNALHRKSHCKIDSVSEKNLVLQLELLPLARPDGYFLLKAVRQAKEEVYAEVMENHCVGSYTLHSDGLLLSANKSFLDLIEVRSFNEEPIYLPELINSKHETKLTTRLNNNINVYVSAKMLYDSSGDQQIFGLVTPKNFERSEFLDAPVAIAQLDRNGNVLKHNHAFSSLVNNVKFKRIADIVKDEIDFNLYFTQAAVDEISSNLNLINDKVVSMLVKKSVTDNFMVFFFDITKYKKIEEQLIHSQKIQSVGELAGGIAHDFNNILTAIWGFCDLILIRCNSKDSTFVDIMQIKQNVDRATNLVGKLLAFSRCQTLQLEVLEISEVLDNVVPLIRRLIGTNIKLKINYLSNLGRVKADKRQLEQVVMNLAINARDAMSGDNGNFVITVSEEVITAGIDDMIPADHDDVIVSGEYIVLKFSDDGCGISEDIITKIFNPFFSTKKENEGTGLGLSMVYGIVRQIGGYIYIKSDVGKGTQINIYLRKVYEKVSQISDKEKSFKSSNDSLLFVPKNILLVEDEETVRILIKRALENERYTVYDYSASVDALEEIRSKKIEIDIVLTDIIMPEMSGVDMVSDIRKFLPDIKVIFISGYSKKKLEKINYKYSFLQKPFSLGQVVAKIQEVSNSDH